MESASPFLVGTGTCSIGTCHTFNGSIDEVMIYNRVLPENEILQIVNAGNQQ